MNALKYHYILDYIDPVPYGDIALRQIGIAYCEPFTVINTHSHSDFFELTVVISGKGTVFTNGVATPISEDDIYVSFPYEEHRIETEKDSPLKYQFFAFVAKKEIFKTELYSFKNIQTNPLNRVIRNTEIKDLIKSALSEISSNGVFSHLYLEMLFSQILIQLIRSLKNQNSSISVTPSKAEELCYQVTHYIDTHIPLSSMEELSKVFHYSYEHLSTVFLKTTKQTLSSYYRLKRLDVARKFLQEGILSLTEIADRINYSSLFAFSKAFKQQYGISPSAYRKNFAKNGKMSK